MALTCLAFLTTRYNKPFSGCKVTNFLPNGNKYVLSIFRHKKHLTLFNFAPCVLRGIQGYVNATTWGAFRVADGEGWPFRLRTAPNHPYPPLQNIQNGRTKKCTLGSTQTLNSDIFILPANKFG